MCRAAGSQPIPAGELSQLVSEATRGGCALTIVEGTPRIREVAELMGEGTARNLADAEVFAEFTGWLRRPGDQRPDGLPIESLGFGSLEARSAPLVLRPEVMRRLVPLGLHRLAARTQEQLARSSAAFGVLYAPTDQPSDAFNGGRALLRVWLRATALGLRVHPMTAAIDHADTRAALVRLCGENGKSALLVCFRLGYGPLGRRAPRLPVERLLRN